MTNVRRANSSARNKLSARVKREEHTCWLCNEPVDKTLTFQPGRHGPRCSKPNCQGCIPHPMRAEIDEIVPVSKGGSPLERANCRLAHRICNQRRGNRPPESMTRKPPKQLGALKTSRRW